MKRQHRKNCKDSVATYPIPEDWEVVRLVYDKCFSIIMGQSPPSSSYNKSGEGLPFLQGCSEFGKIFPSPTLFCSMPIKVAEPGDILISVRAPVGEINIAHTKLCIGRGLAALRPNQKLVDTYYVYHALLRLKQVLRNRSSGSTFNAIKKNDLANLPIPLPPLPEQKRIAEVLRTVDEAIEKVDREMEHTERLKRGLMQHLLTRGIGHTRFKDSPLGKIPETWEVVRLGEIAEVKGGKRVPKGYHLLKEKTPYPYIRVTDFKNMSVDVDGVQYVTRDVWEKLKRYAIFKDDVYISIAGTIGIAGTIPEELDGAILTENAARLCKLKSSDKMFLAYFLNSTGARRQITRFTGAAQQPKLALFRLENLFIPLPPLPEQRKIAEILMTVDRKLELLRREKEHLQRLKRGLMDDLLTGRRRLRVEGQSSRSPLMPEYHHTPPSPSTGEGRGGGEENERS